MTGYDLILVREFLDLDKKSMAANMGMYPKSYNRLEARKAHTIWQRQPLKKKLLWSLVDIKQGNPNPWARK